jgi:biofilm PGA synthesis lipoprotein PgaB
LIVAATAHGAGRDARLPIAYAGETPGALIVLSYHEARDDVREYPDPYAVGSAELAGQFEWLRANGYTPVNIDQVLAARAGGRALPPKAVLLTFDDGYLSFYTRVYPLLQEFHYPAVLAIVGKWIDAPRGEPSVYGEKNSVAAASFPTWGQVREMADSGFVELASHTYDLHRGVLANPQLNLQPAATARTYDPAKNSYEDDTSWRTRVSLDLAANSATLERETGRRPRVIVWPYGSYNVDLIRIAAEWGMTIGLTLDDGANTPDVPLTAQRRRLVEHNPALAEFIIEMRGPRFAQPLRAVQISLDDVYSTDAAQQERNLSALLDRVRVLQPTHVYLQATTDTNGDGIAHSAYFPNRRLPLRADLFNRVAWQLASRVDVKVFAVMPVVVDGMSAADLAEVYADLARHANFDGLMFDERAPAPAVERAGHERTRPLAAAAREFRAPLQTVRTLQIDASGTSPLAQRYSAFAAEYDYVALLAAPTNPAASAAVLLSRVGREAADPLIARKTIFMLSTGARPAAGAAAGVLAAQMRALQAGGALNFGFATDDFLHDLPPLREIAPLFSLRVNPANQPARTK